MSCHFHMLRKRKAALKAHSVENSVESVEKTAEKSAEKPKKGKVKKNG